MAGTMRPSKTKSAPQNNNKKRGDAKKVKRNPKEEEERLSKNSAVILSRALVLLISALVLIAAILLKPMLEDFASFQRRSSSNSPISEDKPPEAHLEDDSSRWAPPSGRIGFLISRACQLMHCHEGLTLTDRFFRATKKIEPGEVLFRIPRSMQIWDLDALRDPWIRLHLFEARHKLSGNKVGSEAYLAAYLALKLKRFQLSDDMDPLELAYLDSLLSIEQFRSYHPLLHNATQMKELLGYSESYDILHAYRNMIVSEYEAFNTISEKFAELISRDDYLMARLNVLTRAIRVGPPGPEQVIKGNFLIQDYTDEQLLEDELTAYKHILDIDLANHGSIALIPIADLLNHHPNNNAAYEYKSAPLNKDGALVVTAVTRRIESGFEPMVSYGVMPDAHLFARYGFVNGDGTAPIVVTLAFHHDILKLNMSHQYHYLPNTGMNSKLSSYLEKSVAEYLRFDDGYAECIPGPNTHPEEAELKLLKHRHLMKIANMPERWTFTVPSRNPYSLPGVTHNVQITRQAPQYMPFYTKNNFQTYLPRSTCRLISLINSDLNGRAAQILRDNLNNDTFIIDEGNDALEYRSLMCMARLMSTGLASMETQGSLRSEYDRVMRMNEDGSFGTLEWSAYHVRFAEMQALQAVSNMVYEKAVEGRKGVRENPPTEYIIMNDACPREYVNFLFEAAAMEKYRIEY